MVWLKNLFSLFSFPLALNMVSLSHPSPLQIIYLYENSINATHRIEVVAQTHTQRNSAAAESRTHRNLNPCNFFVVHTTHSTRTHINIDFFLSPSRIVYTKSVLHFQWANEYICIQGTQKLVMVIVQLLTPFIHMYLSFQPFHSSPIDQKPKKKTVPHHSLPFHTMNWIRFYAPGLLGHTFDNSVPIYLLQVCTRACLLHCV